MKDIIFQTYITDPYTCAEIEVKVFGKFYPGASGTRHGFDRFAEPDEPPEIEIWLVSEIGTGRELTETDIAEDWERLLDECLEHVNEGG